MKIVEADTTEMMSLEISVLVVVFCFILCGTMAG